MENSKRAVFIVALLALGLRAEAEPKKGGTLIFGRGGDSVGLDPASETDGESLNICDQIFDSLVGLKTGSTEIVPALATTWDVSKDGLIYTFKLRPNVKFHDGNPMNADAVVFTFMRQFDAKHPAHDFGGPYEYFNSLGLDKLISKIEKVDDLTVRFTLHQPDATFVPMLALQSFGIVSPAAVLQYKKDFAQHPVGTGPFSLVKWEKNQKIILKANDSYWNGRPYLDTVVVRAIPDNSTRLMEMLSGNIHVMDNPNPDDLKVIEQKMGKKVRLEKQFGLNLGYLAMNEEKKPFDNLKVRQAISHAINKQAIIQAIYAGNAKPAVNPMPPTLWGYNASVKDYEYNPTLAKKLLKEAGFDKGFTTTLWAMPVPRPYMPNGRKVAEAIQSDLAKIGITCKIVSYEWGTYLEKTRNGEHDMALLGWTGDIGDPDNFLYVLLDKDNAVKPAQNISFYKSEKVHDLLMKAKREPEQAKRAGFYESAQLQIHADAPMVNLVHSLDIVPVNAKVHDFVMDPTGRRRFAKVWLE